MSGPASDDEDEGRQSRRKQKQYAHVSSGCGFGRPKKLLLESFWKVLWPQLAKLGWTKVELTGKQAGSIYFVPKDVVVATARKGQDYYDRIRDVLDRILSQRNAEEAVVAESFLSDVEVLQELQELEVIPRTSEKRPPATSGAKSPPLDVSWKYDGSVYQKKTSRIGENFNATRIPAAGTFSSTEEGNEDREEMQLCELIFDYRRAEEKDILPYINDIVPHNKKEAAIACAAQQDYDLTKIMDVVGSSKPHDGSDWTAEEKEEFKTTFYFHKKDLVATAKTINKPVNDVFTYYLGSFKKSDDYRLLKVICDEARAEKNAAMEHYDSCGYCGDGGSLLICDGCEGEYHLACLRPPLANIPEGHWECDDCVDRKFLEIRDDLIQDSKLFVRVDSGDATKRQADDVTETNSSEMGTPNAKKLKTTGDAYRVSGKASDIMLRPSSPVIVSVRKMAACISRALASA